MNRKRLPSFAEDGMINAWEDARVRSPNLQHIYMQMKKGLYASVCRASCRWQVACMIHLDMRKK